MEKVIRAGIKAVVRKIAQGHVDSRAWRIFDTSLYLTNSLTSGFD